MLLTRIAVLVLVRLQLWGGPAAASGSNPSFPADRVQLNYSLTEEQPAGIVLGNVKEAFLKGKSYAQETLSRLRFAFLRSEGQHLEYFEMEPESGILKTRDVVDRELLCASESSGECELEFEVAVRPVPVSYLEVVVVTAHIIDINDDQPQFLKSAHTVNVSETALPGATFILPMAQDLDSRAFGVQNYLLADPPPEFALQVNSNDGLPSDVRLVLRQKLDRESQASYNLHLVAVDGGTPPLSGTLTVIVQVLDANDNSPVFDEDSYEGSVREDAELETVVVQVHATDPDEGLSAIVLYDLVTDGGLTQNLPFSIRTETGEIYVDGPLDFESKPTYMLTVSARDKGPSSVPTNTRVTIHVLDVNDHAPRIIVNSLTPSGKVEVPENAEPGQFVAHLSVEDIDAGQNGLVTCKTENEHFDVEMIYTNEYKVVTQAPCDREASEIVRVLITCTDNAQDPLESQTEVEIHILDQNDQAPQFSIPVYSVTVQENNPIGIPLLTVNATDKDVGENAEVSYEVDEDGQNLVTIDSKSGLLRTNAVFDHEKMAQLEFHVIAYDGGFPTLSSSATVVVKVLDVNDAYPIFAKAAYNFATFENQPVGTEIGTVSANDADDPPYDTVTYTMQARQDVADAFRVEPNTGKIVAKRVLDREARPMYTMNIIASNAGTSHGSSTTSVTVYVADVNDNPPIFTFPNPDNYSVTIPSNAPPGFIVTRLEASDADFSENAKLLFDIVQDDWGIFAVDTHTGIITVGKHWKHIEGDYFGLRVSVTDRGDSPLTSTADLHIIVNKTLTAMVIPGKLQQSDGPIMTGSQLILLLSAISLLLIIVLIIAVVVVKRQLHNRKREERGRYAYRVDLTPTPSATLPDIQFTEANDSGSDPANSEFTPIDNFRNERTLSSASASAGAAAAGATDLHNLSQDASSSQQGTDDGRDFGTWDRQMITEVAVEPGAGDARFSPSTQSTMQLPQRDNSRLTPSPRPDLNPPPPPLHTGSSDPTSRAQPGAGLAPQLIDTSALLHHLNWLQNNPNAQMVPMVPLAAACGNSGCNESCGEEEKDDNTDSASSGSSGSEGAAGGDSSGSSVCSADVSFSDSGRGTSEDDCHAMALASLNNHRNGTTYEQLHVPGKVNSFYPSPTKCSRVGPQKPPGSSAAAARYTSLHPVQPNKPRHQQNHYINVPHYMPMAPPRAPGPRGLAVPNRHRNLQHQKNCPCCKVKLLSTIHGQPCGSNSRSYGSCTPEVNSRPISPASGGPDSSRPISPVSVHSTTSSKSGRSQSARSQSPNSVIEMSPVKTSVHSHPNCKCDVNISGKMDNAAAPRVLPKRKAPIPPVRKPSTRLCSAEQLQSQPPESGAVHLQNNLTSECVV